MKWAKHTAASGKSFPHTHSTVQYIVSFCKSVPSLQSVLGTSLSDSHHHIL